MKIQIPATLATLAATVTLTAGCSTPPATPTAAPSSSTAMTYRSGSGSAVSNYLSKKRDDMLRGWELNVSAGLPYDVDRGLADAAAKDGAPLAFSYRSPGLPITCAWIRLPNQTLWTLTGGAATLTRDTTAEQFFLSDRLSNPPQCDRTTSTEAARAQAATTKSLYDPNAEAAALTSGAPYRWTDGCKQYLRIPGERTRFWIPDLPPARGRALSDMEDMYGCARSTPGHPATEGHN